MSMDDVVALPCEELSQPKWPPPGRSVGGEAMAAHASTLEPFDEVVLLRQQVGTPT